ncbi:putative E3 ubiquitin-protein ligase UBR7 [Anguilla rostrata]|uniref:putative E3 ubiquitin-protein ligase UBR7 n=1 Tax=Anguilla rostrata TaxID=7938 RepID=UPI0030CAE18C
MMAVNGGDERTVSLVEVLEEDEELENEAAAVLDGSDPENCSYPQGYVKRQALYACNTCTPIGAEPAGICLACSYKCHDGHDLFELYTKRNFRCDCGNGKFIESKCKLYPGKDGLNTNNKYNHNFNGLYCTCKRPYPDSEDQILDEMIQCIICEDWLHSKHLGCAMEECVELQEMVCESCMNKAPFLWTYASHLAAPPVTKLSPCEAEVEVNVEENTEENSLKEEEEHGDLPKKGEPSASPSSPDDNKAAADGQTSGKRTHGQMEGSASEGGPEGAGCRLRELEGKGPVRAREGAVFWPYFWRSKLCTCVSCKRAYVAAGVPFLLDESDTVLAYENRGKAQQEEEDLLMSALNRLDHVQQLEIIYEYNDMKTELKDYLQRFAEEGRAVSPEDIRGFFEELRARKRRRVDGGQFYCS